ncbi:MAG TPA: tetratricopeptide repeat protein, partial [Candidatus Binataceae bacterium]|nr:tetratricopeptide repeat protein [Candidatus Binataceae bacterium]
MVLAGCSSLRSNYEPIQAVSAADGRPFGGAPAVDIPPSAFAMGAYLKAQVATEDGDRSQALKEYEDVVKYDPNNPALHVQLATLFVGEGRLKDALEQCHKAIALDPHYVRPRLLAAGIEDAFGNQEEAQQ